MDLRTLTLATAFSLAASAVFAQQTEPPNILVIMGDDIGWYNTSA